MLHIVQVGPLPSGHGDALFRAVARRPAGQVALGVRPPPLVAPVLVAPLFLGLSRKRLSSLVRLPAGGRCRRPVRRLLLPVPVLSYLATGGDLGFILGFIVVFSSSVLLLVTSFREAPCTLAGVAPALFLSPSYKAPSADTALYP